MTMDEYKKLQLNERVSMLHLNFRKLKMETKHGHVTKIYNGNYQLQVLFDGDSKPRTIGYTQLDLVND